MLQGSLDNFALDEVLGLLSGTAKTGQLDIKGDRGNGSLVFSDGSLIGGNTSYTANGTSVEDVMFEMLRYQEGTFNFTSRDVEPTDTVENVSNVLVTAENRLADWREIEAAVPSLDHMVLPAADLPAEEITINRSEWAVLTVIASGCPAADVCDRLSMGEVEGSRQIKNLAERALVTVGAPGGAPTQRAKASAAPPAPPAPAPAPAPDSLGEFGGGLDQLMGEDGQRPPMPPSPSEIDEFKGTVEDASELTDDANSGGGLLMKYLQNDD